MENRAKLDFDQLTVGYEFPPNHFKLDAPTVATYLRAVEDASGLYQGSGLVPPMAVAAQAMATLGEGMTLPPGAIHVSQEFEFLDVANTGDSLTSRARVSGKQSRGKFRLLAVDINVLNAQKTILTGKTSFILPG